MNRRAILVALSGIFAMSLCSAVTVEELELRVNDLEKTTNKIIENVEETNKLINEVSDTVRNIERRQERTREEDDRSYKTKEKIEEERPYRRTRR